MTDRISSSPGEPPDFEYQNVPRSVQRAQETLEKEKAAGRNSSRAAQSARRRIDAFTWKERAQYEAYLERYYDKNGNPKSSAVTVEDDEVNYSIEEEDNSSISGGSRIVVDNSREGGNPPKSSVVTNSVEKRYQELRKQSIEDGVWNTPHMPAIESDIYDYMQALQAQRELDTARHEIPRTSDSDSRAAQARRLTGVLAGASAGAQERPQSSPGPTPERISQPTSVNANLVNANLVSAQAEPEEKAPEPVKAEPRRQKARPSPPAAEAKSSTPEPEPPEITADKEFLRAIKRNGGTITPTDPEQRAAGERIRAYEDQQKAEKRATQDTQAAARAGAPPTVSGGTAGTGATASTPTPVAEAAEESNGGQGPSSNEQITRIASNVDTAAREGGPRAPSSEAAVQDARNTIRRSEAGGPVTPEELESARRIVAEKERYEQALRDEAEAERLGTVVGSSVGANARGTAGGTAGGTTATQGTVAPSTVAPYAVDSKEWLTDNAYVEEYRRIGGASPAQTAAYNAAVERMEAARLAKSAANTEAAAQPRTEAAIPTNASGSKAATDQSILDYYKEFPPDNDEDRALVKEIQDRANGRNPEKVEETDPRISGPVPAGADAQSSLVLPRVGDVPTLGDVELPPLKDWRDTTRLETDYSVKGQVDREKERDLKAQREQAAKRETIEKEFQAAQAAEKAKREAAAARNKANWFEANRRINSTGFSGCDITALVRVPRRGRDGFDEERIFNIGTLQTISISTYNSKTPVRALGFKNPVSIARGGRTIAGTMIFNQLHTHVLDESEFGSLTSVLDKNGLLSYSSGVNVTIYDINTSGIIDPTTVKNRKKVWDFSWDTTLNRGQFQKPSDIIPFDIVIWMINESGGMGKIILYDIDIIHDSTTLSVEDIYTEVQYQYMARDIEYFEAYSIDQAYEWQGVTLPNVVTRKVMEEDIVDPTAEDFGESA